MDSLTRFVSCLKLHFCYIVLMMSTINLRLCNIVKGLNPSWVNVYSWLVSRVRVVLRTVVACDSYVDNLFVCPGGRGRRERMFSTIFDGYVPLAPPGNPYLVPDSI